MNNALTVRKATELDAGDVFFHGAEMLEVVKVGDFFTDAEQGNFQSLIVRNLVTNSVSWGPLRASTLVRLCPQ